MVHALACTPLKYDSIYLSDDHILPLPINSFCLAFVPRLLGQDDCVVSFMLAVRHAHSSSMTSFFVRLNLQLYPHFPPPRGRDGHICSPGLSSAPRNPQETIPLPLRESHYCQGRVWRENSIHVRVEGFNQATCWLTKSLCRFVAILFVDAVQRMWRITAEADLTKSQQGTPDVRAETNLAARKF